MIISTTPQQYIGSYYMISKDRLVDFHASMTLKDFWPHAAANGPCMLVPNISIILLYLSGNHMKDK